MRVFRAGGVLLRRSVAQGQWFRSRLQPRRRGPVFPHRITATKYAKTAQAKRRKAAEGALCAFFEAARSSWKLPDPPPVKIRESTATAAHHKQYSPYYCPDAQRTKPAGAAAHGRWIGRVG